MLVMAPMHAENQKLPIKSLIFQLPPLSLIKPTCKSSLLYENHLKAKTKWTVANHHLALYDHIRVAATFLWSFINKMAVNQVPMDR